MLAHVGGLTLGLEFQVGESETIMASRSHRPGGQGSLYFPGVRVCVCVCVKYHSKRAF